MSSITALEKIEKAIQKANPEEQRKLVAKLPHLLRISLEDLFLLKFTEPSFNFWNNVDDAVYDSM